VSLNSFNLAEEMNHRDQFYKRVMIGQLQMPLDPPAAGDFFMPTGLLKRVN
jgi:hypothetical protein